MGNAHFVFGFLLTLKYFISARETMTRYYMYYRYFTERQSEMKSTYNMLCFFDVYIDIFDVRKQ